MAKYNQKIVTADYKQLKNNDFKKEKDLLEYILLNKEVFCEEVLGVLYKEHMVEYKLPRIDHLYDNTPVIDLIFIDTNNYVHIIELKCPKDSFGENLRGLGQCLTYLYIARMLNLNLADVYLVTANHCNLIPLIIRDNKLNVRYIYFDKTRHIVSDTEQ